jgi:hypothetical protein
MSIGMDLTPEPTMLIHKKYTYHGMLASLYTVHSFFCYHGSNEGKKLLLVILPEDGFAKGRVFFLASPTLLCFLTVTCATFQRWL